MSAMETTAAMVRAASDALDVAAADAAMATAKRYAAPCDVEVYARWLVADAALSYAQAVFSAVTADYFAPFEATA